MFFCTTKSALMPPAPGLSGMRVFSAFLNWGLLIAVGGGLALGLSGCATKISPPPILAVSISPNAVQIVAGTSGTVSFLATSGANFSGTVQATVSGLPSGVTVQPSPIILTPGTATQITFSAAANAVAGSSTATVTFNAGSLSQTASVGVTVIAAADFALNVSPQLVSLVQGGSAQQIQVSTAALNGFVGISSIVLSGLPAGVTASPATVSLSPGGTQTITLSAASSAALGTATVSVVATSGTISHTAAFALSVVAAPDFSLTVSPQGLNLNRAQTGQIFQIAATAVNGFTGLISVSLSGMPTGVSASSGSLTLTPGVPQTVTLLASASATLGSGSVMVNATSGSLAHTSTEEFTVWMAGILHGPFVHPGISHSQADLDRMRTKATVGVEPYKSAYAFFSSMGYSGYANKGQGPYTYETYNHGQFEIRNDAQVAHQNAIMWYITGDTRYRDNAIQLMMAWANTLTAFDVTDYLTAGTCIIDWTNAGEILRSSAGSAWTPAMDTQFQNWILNVIYPALLSGAVVPPVTENDANAGGPIQAAGAGGLQMSGMMALGVYTNRADIYNFAVAAWQHLGYYSYGLREYIDVSGQNYESQRDTGHASGNIGTFAQNAYIVWNQGQDLFQMDDNLLAKATESQAKWDMGWDVAPIPFTALDGRLHVKMSSENIQYTGNDNLNSELAYYIYHGIKGLNMPYTKLSADVKFPDSVSGGGSWYYLVDDTGMARVKPLIGQPAATGVVLYEDELGGTYFSTNFQPGTYSAAQLSAGGLGIYGSGGVTSMQVPIGWTVTAYSGDHQTGNSLLFTGTLGNQGIADMIALNFNDELRSMVVTAGTQPYPVFNSTYELVNQNSGLVAEVVGSSVNPGAMLDQSANTTAITQLWKLQALGHGQYLIENVNSHLALEVPASASGPGAALDQQAFVPEPDLATGGTASASSGAAVQAFDQSANTKWYDAVLGGTAWLQYQMPQPRVVDTYTLVSGNDLQQRDPASWQFLGSNDGVNWTTLDTQTAQVFAKRQQPYVYSFSNSTAYPYYRLNVTANEGGSAYGVQLSEMYLNDSLSGATNQRWVIAPVAGTALGSAFTIVNVGSGQSLDVSGSSQSSGAGLVQTSLSGGASQRWALQIPSLLLP